MDLQAPKPLWHEDQRGPHGGRGGGPGRGMNPWANPHFPQASLGEAGHRMVSHHLPGRGGRGQRPHQYQVPG